MRARRHGWPLLIGLTLGISTGAAAATLEVSNTGIDGATCGIAAPCRSIARAIANALPGDTIQVGPGSYGNDLDADGVFNESGEEPTTGLGSIVVDKPLRIFSRLGASSTALRGSGPVFTITASNVELGALNRGFTIASDGIPVVVAGQSQLRRVRVAGNVLVIDGPVGPAGLVAINTREGRFEHNRVVGPLGCSSGFYLSNSGDLVASNVVAGCSVGFFSESAAGARFVRNTAIGSVIQPTVGAPVGFELEPGNIAEFSGNAALGNGTGVRIWNAIPIFRNNTFAASTTNCGLRNMSGVAFVATNNYWGAATGPGPDPADDVCEVSAAKTTITTPFLTSDPTQAQSALR